MTDLVLSQGVRVINGVEMMSTKGIMSICEKIGEPKRHADIIRDVRNMLKSLDAVLRLNITDSYEEEKETLLSGKEETVQFWLNKKLCDTLISGYSIPIRYAIIEEFDKLSNQKKTPSLPTDFISALEALLDSKKAEQKALAQAEYQDRALTTSQVKNGALTKTVKKLKNQLRGYDEYVSLNSFLAINKISLWDRDKKVQSSSKGLVAKLKKMGLDGNEWILKTFEGQEFPTTVFDPDFLANHIDFIMGEIERLIKGKRPQQTQESV